LGRGFAAPKNLTSTSASTFDLLGLRLQPFGPQDVALQALTQATQALEFCPRNNALRNFSMLAGQ